MSLGFELLCNRNQKKKLREERAEKEQQVERENKMLQQQMMILEQKKQLLEMQTAALCKKEKKAVDVKSKEKEREVKETTFESPTEEEIKQLMMEPKNLLKKKGKLVAEISLANAYHTLSYITNTFAM